MKTLFTLLIACLISTCAIAQNDSKTALLVNGKTLKGGEVITKDDLKALCALQVVYQTGAKAKPASFTWVVSYKGEVWKGNCSNSTLAIEKIADKAGSKAVVFIDELILSGGIKARQYAFTLQ